MTPLPTEFYNRNSTDVARDLLGKRLIRITRQGRTEGRIVEVEAYLGSSDTASHSYRGRTRRNAAMFGLPGRAYVYAIHSRYCMNAVTEEKNVPTAVLIRAIEPLIGIPIMMQRRGTDRLLNLTRGPARLCEAMAIDKQLLGWDLSKAKRLWIGEDRESEDFNIAASPRVGVTSAKEDLLRFYISENRFVSRYRRHR